MWDNKIKIDEIRKYYMNPKAYPNDSRELVENAISQINGYLKVVGNGGDDGVVGSDLFASLCDEYTTDESYKPINTLMRQSRADEEGVSATRGYREIYFNEIVQNANDNTDDNYLNIYADKNDNKYQMEFEYADSGFSVENIIGLFNSEIHTKKNNLSTTGKHGVGIKALFYFVDILEIRSNIIATFKIETKFEDGIEKIISAKSQLTLNKDWDQKTTHLFIKYRKKDTYGEFNVHKLNKLIDLICKEKTQKVTFDEIKEFFCDIEQKNLVFDCRSLLFTDKNKGKTKGIKKISFIYREQERFSISAVQTKPKIIENDSILYYVEGNSIQFNEEKKLDYIVATSETTDGQNFSIAIPSCDKIRNGALRFYETFYIPEVQLPDEHKICISFNFLINSKYSSVDRRKLTDYDKELPKIITYIDEKIVTLLKQLTLNQTQKILENEIRIDFSKIFHKCLLMDDKFVSLCYLYEINNRYLMKYQSDARYDQNKFIIYQREEKELYEKKLIGQQQTVDEVKRFFEENIIGTDSMKYDEKLFFDEVKESYEKAFNFDCCDELRTVLNAIGTMSELILYRITGSQYSKNILERNLDCWLQSFPLQQRIIALSIIGRYKIHPGVGANGIIKSTSFYEYLFSDEETATGDFAEQQRREFSEKYGELKKRLHSLLVNKEQRGIASLWNQSFCVYTEGKVAFLASWDCRARRDVYYDKDNWKESDCSNEILDTKTFGNDLFGLLINRFICEPDMCKHIKLFNGKMMLTDASFPEWGDPVPYYGRKYILNTSKWFTARVINLNFMSNIIADNLEQFKEYVMYFTKNRDSWFGYTFTISAVIDYSDNTLTELMDIYYKYNLLNDEKRVFSTISLKIRNKPFTPKGNLCPKDYYDFIYNITGLEISLAQVANIQQKGKELIYLYNDYVKIYNNNKWIAISQVEGSKDKKVTIFINERLDWKNALCLVLKDICQEDIVEKCEAYIPQNQVIAVWGEKFTEIQDNEYSGEIRSRNIDLSERVQPMSAEQIKYIITARGNNNNLCGCCGKSLKNQNLIIVANASLDTNQQYPYIINVLCDECFDLLRKSHKESFIVFDEQKGEFFVEHKCLLQNSHQQKEITKKYQVSKGIVCMWKRTLNNNLRT